MKLIKKSVERVGDKLTVHARFKSHMRTPVDVKLTLSSGDTFSGDDVLITGDVRDVSGVLNAIAEIAWSQGWRPRGIIGSVARHVETYIEPPVAK